MHSLKSNIDRTVGLKIAFLLLLWCILPGCQQEPSGSSYEVGKEYVYLVTKNQQYLDTLILKIHADTLNYNQQKISWRSGTGAKEYYTGMIKNTDSLWIHPPRHEVYKILQQAPYPFITDLGEGKTEWNWNFEISPIWITSANKAWEGLLNINTHYKVLAKKQYMFNNRQVESFEVQAISRSEIGEMKANFTYSPSIGFVLLDYHELDGMQLTLRLIQVKPIAAVPAKDSFNSKLILTPSIPAK